MVNTETYLSTFWSDGRPRNFYNGTWQDPVGATFATIDPSTGREIAQVPDTSAAEVNQVVAHAAAAQVEWGRRTMESRAEVLYQFADAIERIGKDLTMLESIDSGNSHPSTMRDLGMMVRYLRSWPGMALAAAGRASRPGEDMLSIVLNEPYGVVGKIVAYNHPALFAVAGSINALMAGNTIVVKASPQTPLGTLAIGAAAAEVFPPGVLNVIAGGTEAGDALVVHPTVRRLAFTGSLPTALAIQSRLSLSGTVKHLTTELGGKNAMIVFPDADMDAAVRAAVGGMSLTVSAGQSCQSTSRLLVHQDCYGEFIERTAHELDRLAVGVAYDPETQMGPLVTAEHRHRVVGFKERAEAAGARNLCREVLSGDLPKDGYYLNPVLFDSVTPDMEIAQEEVFGPILSAMPWQNYDDLMKVVNGSSMGLSASIWSQDITTAIRAAQEVEAGYVWINDNNRHYLGAPFGGFKDSGIGREESIEELASHWQQKSINIRVP